MLKICEPLWERETCCKMSAVDRVSRDSETVFSIRVFNEEPRMSVSVYFYLDIMLGCFLLHGFVCFFWFGFNSGNKLLSEISEDLVYFFLLHIICIILCYTLLLILTLELKKKKKYWIIFVSRLKEK